VNHLLFAKYSFILRTKSIPTLLLIKGGTRAAGQQKRNSWLLFQKMDYSLQTLIENGILDPSYAQEQMDMIERKKILENHPNKIWKGSDEKWYTYLPSATTKSKRILKKRATKKEIENVVVDYWKATLQNPTLQEIFDEWNDRRLELHKIVPASHLRLQQVFNRHFTEFGKRKIKNISENEVSDFLEHELADKSLSSKAFSSLKSVTRGMLKRAKRRGLTNINVETMFLELDISEQEFSHRTTDSQLEVFDECEMLKVISHIKENPDIKNLGIALMFASGLRVGELVSLKYSDFDRNTISIHRTETRYKNSEGHYEYAVKNFPKTKAGKRTIVIPDGYQWLMDKLCTYNTKEEYVFVDSNGIRINSGRIRKRLYYLCNKLEIPVKSPHKVRKTYGTILLDSHVDSQFIQEQMGHTDIACTERYYHYNRKSSEQKKEIINSISEFHAS